MYIIFILPPVFSLKYVLSDDVRCSVYSCIRTEYFRSLKIATA